MMLGRTKIWSGIGAASLGAVVALLAAGCGDEVAAVKANHSDGPSLGLHRPRQGGFGG
jgi:hypothetical protein